MATELGQAYVQIIPSAKGISGSVQKALAPEADAAGESAGNSIGSKMVTAIKVALAGAAIGKFFKASLLEGADLQQSLGGIETLFKGSADKVKKYADEAYRTAGLSANDYMENVTSFSASLLQSMGGDTEKAADKANMAMVDMSDNANKMGTNMGDIQNAYMGFAKQNYTMLDNLKLGYGGTKTEMERLLADATKLTGVKYDIENLADVYDAIHAVQEELDITGTTAKESAETFSGSLASMKSSFSNFLGKLSLGQDIGPSLKALADTVSTFLFGNLLPMVGNILKQLPGAIVTFLGEAVPLFYKAGKDFISSLTNGMSGSKFGPLLWLQSTINWIILDVQNLSDQLNNRLGGIKELFDKLLKGVQPILTKLSGLISGWVVTVSGVLSVAIPLAIDILIAVFDGFQSFVLPVLDFVIDKIWSFSSMITEAITNNAIPALENLTGWVGNNQSIFENFGKILGVILAGFVAFKTITTVISVFNTVKTAITGVATAFKALTVAMATNPFVLIAAAIAALVAGFIYLWQTNEGFKNAVIEIWTSISEFLSPIISGIVDFIMAIWTPIVEWWNANQQSILTTVQNVWNSILTTVQSVLGFLQMIIQTVLSNIQAFWNTWGATITNIASVAWNAIQAVISGVINQILNIITSVFNQISIIIQTVMGIIQGIIKVVTGVISGDWSMVWEGIKQIVSSIFDGIKGTIENAMNTASDTISNIIDTIKGVFESLGDIDLLAAGKAIMDSFLGGLKETWNKVTDFVGGIADWIAENKGPISYDRKLLIPAGKAIMTGFNDSLQTNFKDVKSTVSGMADELSDSFSNLTISDGMIQSELAALKESSLDSNLAYNLSKSFDINSELDTTESNNEILRLLKRISDKETAVFLGKTKVSEELGESNDAVQMRRTNSMIWGLEV